VRGVAAERIGCPGSVAAERIGCPGLAGAERIGCPGLAGVERIGCTGSVTERVRSPRITGRPREHGNRERPRGAGGAGRLDERGPSAPSPGVGRRWVRWRMPPARVAGEVRWRGFRRWSLAGGRPTPGRCLRWSGAAPRCAGRGGQRVGKEPRRRGGNTAPGRVPDL